MMNGPGMDKFFLWGLSTFHDLKDDMGISYGVTIVLGQIWLEPEVTLLSQTEFFFFFVVSKFR